MTKLITGIVLVSCALFMFQCDPTKPEEKPLTGNLIEDGEWFVDLDVLGSTVESSNSAETTLGAINEKDSTGRATITITKDTLSVKFKRVAQTIPMETNDFWPFVQLFVGVEPGYFDNYTHVVMSYKSDKDVALGLVLPATSQDGSAHRAVLDPTKGLWETAEISLAIIDSGFVQPFKGDSGDVTLDLSKVQGFAIQHEIDDYESEHKSNLEISFLRGIKKEE